MLRKEGIEWKQIGNVIEGYQKHTITPNGLDLSSDGNRIAAGSINFCRGLTPPQAKLFEFKNNQWNQIGNSIVSDGLDDSLTGASVSISNDGTILAVGESWKDGVGQVRVFKFPNYTSSSEDLNFNYSIYPNPSSDFINIKGVDGKYFIYDLNGKLLQTGMVNPQSIDISSLSKGMYILKIYSSSRTIVSRIVKI